MWQARKEMKTREEEERKEKNLDGNSGGVKEKKQLGDTKTKTKEIFMNVDFKNLFFMSILSCRVF
jgi:hypothetical protein